MEIETFKDCTKCGRSYINGKARNIGHSGSYPDYLSITVRIKFKMIHEEKQKKAIHALRDLTIEARTLAFKGVPNAEMASFLDDVELLPGLILEEKDRTDFFESYLYYICNLYNCTHVFNRYKRR